jgi:hypothetical protein
MSVMARRVSVTKTRHRPLSRETNRHWSGGSISPDDVDFRDEDESSSWGDTWWMKTTTTTTIVPASVSDAETDLAVLAAAAAASDEFEYPLGDNENFHPASDIEVSPAELFVADADFVDDIPVVPSSPQCVISDLTANRGPISRHRTSSISYSVQTIEIGSAVAVVRGERLTPEISAAVTEFDDNITEKTVIPTMTITCDAVDLGTDEEASPVTTVADDAVDLGQRQLLASTTVVHEYGEMLTIFRRLPPFLEALRESLARRHGTDPHVCRLLARHPQLQPGFWRWLEPPTVAELRRRMRGPSAGDQEDATDGGARQSAAASIVHGTSYSIEPVMEKFDSVIE